MKFSRQIRTKSKGEFVVLVTGNMESQGAVDGLDLAIALREYIPASQAARIAARLTNGSRRELYKALEGSQESAGRR